MGDGPLYIVIAVAAVFHVGVPVAPLLYGWLYLHWDGWQWDAAVQGQPGLAATGVSKTQTGYTANSAIPAIIVIYSLLPYSGSFHVTDHVLVIHISVCGKLEK